MSYVTSGSTRAIAYKKTIAPFLFVLSAYRLPTCELSLTSHFPQRPHIVLSKEHYTFKLLSLCHVCLYNLAIEFNAPEDERLLPREPPSAV